MIRPSAALLVFLALHVSPAMAQLRLPRILSDGAVLQRGHEVPVWGWAAPGADVAVTLGGERRTAEAGADGRWHVAFDAMEAGGPHALRVEAGAERVDVADLLVGDVWVASGQSNMEWTLKDARDGASETAAAHDAGIRHFKVPQSFAEAPADDLAGGAWAPADPEHAGDFTAVGYFFARDLRRAHPDVPVGILHTSWGGSRIEPWMSAEMLGLDAAGVAGIFEAERAHEQAVLDRVRDKIGGLPESDGGLVDGVALWADPALDDGAWATIRVPAQWESVGYDGMDGVAWYRTAFDLTAEEAAAGVTLGLGMVDDDDVTWVNGVEVGRMTDGWNRARVYPAPPSALRAGRNVVAVRVEDFQGGGGIAGTPDLVYVETAAGARRPLASEDWRFKVGHVRLGAASHKNQVPTVLWNQMVAPVTGFPVAGFLWYQGESNADTMADAVAYRALFAGMIEGWRVAWGQGDLPFLWVQLANYMEPAATPGAASNWATLRESQSAALALDGTGQAVTIDVGEGADIHPRNKQDVGARLALEARRVAYDERDLVSTGPVFRGLEADGGRLTLTFDRVGGGLRTRGGAAPGGFAVAGADRRWVWAEAAIEGDRVLVWSEAVPEPVAVRYAWADNPTAATLVNAAGLPAGPFRTDDW